MTWPQAARLISSSVNAASGKATDALIFASLLLPKWSQCYQFRDSVSKVETPLNTI